MTRIRACSLLLVAACQDARFEPLSVPPPGKTASLDDEAHTLAISRGVALAFECRDSRSLAPCGSGSAVAADADVLDVYVSYLDELSAANWRDAPQTRTVFVVVGREPGETTLALGTSFGDETFRVTVSE